jgi:hypothetical protein
MSARRRMGGSALRADVASEKGFARKTSVRRTDLPRRRRFGVGLCAEDVGSKNRPTQTVASEKKLRAGDVGSENRPTQTVVSEKKLRADDVDSSSGSPIYVLHDRPPRRTLSVAGGMGSWSFPGTFGA